MKRISILPTNLLRAVSHQISYIRHPTLSSRHFLTHRTPCIFIPQSLRTYASPASGLPAQPKAPSVAESASQLAAHLTEHPEKLNYMIKVLSQQLGSIRREVEQKDKQFEADEAKAVLDALGNTLDTLMPAVQRVAEKERLEELMVEIVKLRTSL